MSYETQNQLKVTDQFYLLKSKLDYIEMVTFSNGPTFSQDLKII